MYFRPLQFNKHYQVPQVPMIEIGRNDQKDTQYKHYVWMVRGNHPEIILTDKQFLRLVRHWQCYYYHHRFRHPKKYRRSEHLYQYMNGKILNELGDSHGNQHSKHSN